jgi:hypothetical protein
MSRFHIKNDVVGFLEKTIPLKKAKEIEAHLGSCETCRHFLERFSSVYSSDDHRECHELTPYFYTRVLSQLEKGPDKEYILPVSIVKSLRPVAAGLFLVTLITFSVFLSNYIFSTNRINSGTPVNTVNEMSYEYYVGNGDPVVDLIVSNEK